MFVTAPQDVCACVCVFCVHIRLCIFADVLKAQERRSCGLGLNVSTRHCLQSLSFALPRTMATVVGGSACVSGRRSNVLTCIFVCSCVLAGVGVCFRLFTSVFMCTERDCKFTEWNVNVCRPHATETNENVTTDNRQAKHVYVCDTSE